MNNAGKSNKKRSSKTTEKEKRSSTSKSVDNVFYMDANRERRKPSVKRQKKTSTNNITTNAFLKNTFHSKVVVFDAENLEGDFNNSLSILANELNLQIEESTEKYPLNLVDAFNNIKYQLQNCTYDSSKFRLVQMGNEKSTFFVEEIYFDTGYSMYHVPIYPIICLLEAKESKADLFLSIYSYLLNIVSVPYHREEGTFYYSIYEWLKEILKEEEDSDEEYAMLAEIEEAEKSADLFHNEIADINHLLKFESRVIGYHPKNDYDFLCLNLAKEFLSLYKQYPNTRLDNKIKYRKNSDDDSNQSTPLEAYVSFVDNNNGNVYNRIFRMANDSLQENCSIDEPVIYKVFSNKTIKIENNDFDFEERIFNLITRLIALFEN